MATASFAPAILAKIREVTAMCYAEQAKFYLNAFWSQGADQEAETVWSLCNDFTKEDDKKGKDGNELNPSFIYTHKLVPCTTTSHINLVQAFHLLQGRSQTLTALELKAQLRKVDIDANGEMALAEYLLFTFNRDPVAFVTNPQGEVDPAVLAATEKQLNDLSTAFDALQVQLESQKAAERAAVAAEAKAKSDEAAAVQAESDAKQAEVKAKQAEDAVRAVEEEARVIAATIKAEEDAKAAEEARLEALTKDDTVGIVKRNMAVQQLAQLKGQDSLPLQKAKLTQDAVVRRLARATEAAAKETAIAAQKSQEASDAREAAVAAREAAVKATIAAEEASKETEKQVDAIKVQIAEVEAELERLKSSSGAPMGALWWQSRTIEDKKRSLPTRMH